MALLEIILIVIGLCLFETISSIDNAVINAEVLSTMSKKARMWFLTWGLLIAVFLIRGLLPFLIVWFTNPSMGFNQLMSVLFHSDPAVIEAVEASAPVLLVGGGTFLVFLFFHWIFLEPKNYGLKGEAFIHKQGIWFYAVVSIVLAVIVWLSIQTRPSMAMGAVVGSTAFFITHGFKENAAQMEEKMIEGKASMSDVSKILYLEVIDSTFSVDGVLGAFAFTLSVPLILLGNGLGALVVRSLTIHNIETVKKYKYLKNGAMYSIFALGMVMILDSFHVEISSWVSPVLTMSIIGYFFYKSHKELQSTTPREM